MMSMTFTDPCICRWKTVHRTVSKSSLLSLGHFTTLQLIRFLKGSGFQRSASSKQSLLILSISRVCPEGRYKRFSYLCKL